MNAVSPTFEEMCQLLAELLAIGTSRSVTPESPLLGVVPQFDSIAVASFLTLIEDRYGCDIDDGELTADTFETYGSLYSFVVSHVQD